MKVIVIGLGSMGKRRIRLIRQISAAASIVGVDVSEERRAFACKEFNITCMATLGEAFAEEADCAFVCTSPLTHAKIIKSSLENGLHVFTELNLVPVLYEENMRLAESKNLVLFLSSTFLYRREINYILSRVKKSSSQLNYIYHIGQYLPDWHPWEDYQNYFIGNQCSNGCREIMAIELPWLITGFGGIQSISALKSKITSLNISYDDNFLVSLCHENGAKGILAIDVVSRKAVRRFEMFGEDVYLSWNGTPDTLTDYDITKKEDLPVSLFHSAEHQENYASFVIEDPYRDEIIAFFDKIKNRSVPCMWDFARDMQMLKLIDQIGA
ncbi:Gfo/Idh/MocA family protein [Cloacibacillus evryensis]|uniref:Gfo/Idh/MocA family protein n=1 Tax=Cloacibacillus evryensis TaxID=508460 RepID=UPI0026E05DCD|nr:Gfo/Idh/MocA family oxidoreductase [Cloacibacillus evryensis]